MNNSTPKNTRTFSYARHGKLIKCTIRRVRGEYTQPAEVVKALPPAPSPNPIRAFGRRELVAAQHETRLLARGKVLCAVPRGTFRFSEFARRDGCFCKISRVSLQRAHSPSPIAHEFNYGLARDRNYYSSRLREDRVTSPCETLITERE